MHGSDLNRNYRIRKFGVFGMIVIGPVARWQSKKYSIVCALEAIGAISACWPSLKFLERYSFCVFIRLWIRNANKRELKR